MAVELAVAPAARVLEEITRRNAALGHENLGPLSERNGFIPLSAPPHDLPGPHAVWVQAADELPELISSLTLRRRLEELPLLDASPASLEDRSLLRAASVLGLLTQSYNNVPMVPPEQLPEQLVRPWKQISERLHRPPLTLVAMDYVLNNWRLIDPDAPEPMRVENMALLTPIWDHPEMDTFILTGLETLALTSPLVGCVVRAQEAALREDDDALKVELAEMGAALRRATFGTLPKITAHARGGPRRVDPVVWTKLFATLPLPAVGAGDVVNASGVEIPTFHMMDAFIGRQEYRTALGHEATGLRAAFPQNWAEFVASVGEIPIVGYVRGRDDPELNGLFDELVENYQGRNGLLGRHRLKAFAYMEPAFKVGRSRTGTGFSGERAWEKVDAAFEAARLERQLAAKPVARMARLERVDEVCPGIWRIVLDIRGLGMHVEPGDHIAVLPENDPELVDRTLAALHAGGDEAIDLTREWTAALPLRGRPAGMTRLALRDVLAWGQIRPVPRATAKILHRLTQDASVGAVLEARTEDQWELWDLLEHMSGAGFAPERLWRAGRGDYESLGRAVPPLEPRLYSVSAFEGGGVAADRVELTIGELAYDSVASPTSVARARRGTATTYLTRTVRERPGSEIPVSVVHPAAFSLPDDPSVPIVMFGGGTGIAPFRAFLRSRAETPGTLNILFAGGRTPEVLPYKDELDAYAQSGAAEVQYAYSRVGSGAKRVDGLVREPAVAARLRALVRAGAQLYTCGRAPFSRSVMDALADALDEPGRPGREEVYRLVAEGRYLYDVFTTYPGSTVAAHTLVDASDLSRRTTPQAGLWQAINGRVYDLTEFAEIHPGGQRIIGSFAGMDASSSYRLVEHHRDPEVEAMLAMYEVGVVRRLGFGRRWAVAVGERGLEHLPLETLYRRWVRTLYTLVEIANAHAMEISIRDEPLNRSERRDALPCTAYRLQFAVDAHVRVVTKTLPIVCDSFAGLWRTTCGPCDPAADLRELERALDEVCSSDGAESARRACHRLEDELDEPGAGPDLERRTRALATADAAYLDSARASLATGIELFEAHEADVLSAGSTGLLAALRAFPALTGEYFETVVSIGKECA